MLSRGDRRRDEQKLTMLEQVHHDADRVTRLVTELLDISRLETGRLVLRRTMVDLPALAATVIEKVQMAIPELRCDVSFGSDVPTVYADPDKVEQVLTNLAETAAKYRSPTGRATPARQSYRAVAGPYAAARRGIPDHAR